MSPSPRLDLTFRADCEIYARVFLAAVDFDLISYEVSVESITLPDATERPLPDVTVRLQTAGQLSLRHYCWIASQIPECQIIGRTLASTEQYTGQECPRPLLPVPNPAHIQRCISGLRDKLPLCRRVISEAILVLSSYTAGNKEAFL